MTVDSFDALCMGVAGVVNRRPLTRATNATDDFMVLSPAHFIYPYTFVHSSNAVLPPLPDRGDHLRATWSALRSILDDYWKIWQQEYLETLQKREKWTSSTPPLSIGDVVLVKEPITPRERWRLGRIIEVLGTDDGHPKRYKLRDAAGNCFDRHVTSLIRLELS